MAVNFNLCINMERTGEFTEVPDEVIIRQLEYLDDPREMYSYVKALPPTVRDSVLTTLRESMVRRHREIYIEIYKAHFNWSIYDAVLHAAINGHIGVLKIMGQLYPKKLNSVLRARSEMGDHGAVHLLLDAGADIHTMRDYALQKASIYGHHIVVRILLDAGADVHANKDWALRAASGVGHLEVVRILLEAGADVHAGHNEALQEAARNGHHEVVRILLEAGANARSLDFFFDKRHYWEVVRLLLAAGTKFL
jgi:ankyrin repeat protein